MVDFRIVVQRYSIAKVYDSSIGIGPKRYERKRFVGRCRQLVAARRHLLGRVLLSLTYTGSGAYVLLSIASTLHYTQWCIAKNGGGYTQRGVAKGLMVHCLFMITEVSIRCQKTPEVGIRRIPAYTPPIHH